MDPNPPAATSIPTNPVTNSPQSTSSSGSSDNQPPASTVLADPGGVSLLSLPVAGGFKEGQSVVGDHTYTKTLFASQCDSENLRVALPQDQNRFLATFAMSDFAAKQAAVQATVKLDGAPQQRHDVRHGHPVPVDLPLGNATELEITYTGSFELESVCDINGQFVIVNPSFAT